MQGYYGVEDVCLSLPTLINAKGVVKVLELPLNEQVKAGIQKISRYPEGLVKRSRALRWEFDMPLHVVLVEPEIPQNTGNIVPDMCCNRLYFAFGQAPWLFGG